MVFCVVTAYKGRHLSVFSGSLNACEALQLRLVVKGYPAKVVDKRVFDAEFRSPSVI